MAFQPRGLRGQQQVFGRAPQAGIQVMLVGIDRRTTPRQVWKNGDACGLGLELPRLRIVTGRREDCVADEAPVITCGIAEIVVTPELPYRCRMVHAPLQSQNLRLVAQRRAARACISYVMRMGQAAPICE